MVLTRLASKPRVPFCEIFVVLLPLCKYVTLSAEDVDADFAQQLRIELQKSATAKQ